MKPVRAVAVLCFLAGCTVPKGAGFDDVKKMLAERIDQRVHWNQGNDDDARVAEEMQKLLAREMTVDGATQVALWNNPHLQATYERLGVAQADVVQAGLIRNPSITGHVGFPLGAGVIEWDVSIASEFIDLFLIPLRKKFAKAEFRRVKLEVGDAVLALVAEVREAFYMVQGATQIVAMRKQVLEAQQAAIELSLRQHEAGNVSDLDLSNEQALYTQATLDLARAELQLLAEREKLTRIMGVWGHGTQWTVSAKLPELPPDDPPLEHIERFAIEHRLDLAASREEVRTAAASVGVTKGTRVIGGLEVGVAAHQDADGPRTIGPTLKIELPIFDQKQATLAKLRAQLHQAQRRMEAMALDIRSEVRTARDRLVAARLTANYYAKAYLPLRERIVGLSQQHYNAMLLGVYQLLLAKQNEINAYREYIEVVRDYWIARSDLERAAGGKFDHANPAAPPRQGEGK